MTEPVQPVLVRVPVELAAKLTAEAARLRLSRHTLILSKLAHECQPTEWDTNPIAYLPPT